MFDNRPQVLAIAIIAVVVYHLLFIWNPFGRFNIGYAGVDVFLMFSGYGISKSLGKNSISVFYKNRLKRIYPLFFLFTVIMIVLKLKTFSFLTIFFQLTTIQFWVNPDEASDWYLNYLFSLYLISPLFHRWLKKTKLGGGNSNPGTIFSGRILFHLKLAISLCHRATSYLCVWNVLRNG